MTNRFTKTLRRAAGVLSAVLFCCASGRAAAPAGVTAPADYDQLVVSANNLLKQGKLDQAQQAAKRAIEQEANRYEAYALAAKIASERGATGEASDLVQKALELAPQERKEAVRQLAAMLAPSGSPAPVAASASLSDEDQLTLDGLNVIFEEAAKATGDETARLLREFLSKTAAFASAHPEQTNLWAKRALGAVMLDDAYTGWLAGRQLKALGSVHSQDPSVRKVMAQLERKGWLTDRGPEEVQRQQAEAEGTIKRSTESTAKSNPGGLDTIHVPSAAELKNGAKIEVVPALPPGFKDQKEQMSYSIGMSIARNVKQGLVDLDMDALDDALKGYLAGNTMRMTEEQMMQGIRAYQAASTARRKSGSPVQSRDAEAQNLPPGFKDQKEQMSYSIGMSIARNIKQGQIDLDMDVLTGAMKDFLAGGAMRMTEEQMMQGTRAYQSASTAKRDEERMKTAEKNRKLGDEFLAENKKKKGVKTFTVALPGGKTAEVQYTIITEGTGNIPKSNDFVNVRYRGTTIDGKEFDNPSKRGTNAVKMMVSRAPYKGWSEAWERMKAGSKWELYIPSSLARQDRPIPPNVEAGSALIYEMELIGVEAPPAPNASPIPLTGDIIRVPSLEEIKKGAKPKIIKAEDAEKESH